MEDKKDMELPDKEEIRVRLVVIQKEGKVQVFFIPENLSYLFPTQVTHGTITILNPLFMQH